ASALQAFRDYRQYLVVPVSAQEARARVPGEAGAGKVGVGLRP
ncbi:Pectin lyase, partial [Pseudomonas syringae pv. tomato]